jgi:hypothetical protein
MMAADRGKAEVIGETLHVLLKYQSDIAKARKELVDSGSPLSK